ncbi:MAG TPA: hypothetical protein DDZ81_02520 [Acetobacteraceae bacterium]|nr:hypothetical protein [Acetobacteraceae bacterium]
MDRSEFLLRGIDHATAHGIEIGPFYNPIAPKAAGWNTTVVDFTDQDGLLQTATTHSNATIREMAGNIEAVDVVWRDVRLDEACLRKRPEGFDYLIASHAIEHFPDIITFFQEVSALARPDFILSLAVPDCRMTFDFFRPLSTSGEALRAHREQRTMHTPENMFEAWAYMINLNGAGAWLPSGQGTLELTTPLADAYDKYAKYRRCITDGTQSYVDAHCWIFTPNSFLLMVLELHALGLIDFVVTELEPGEGSEFWVQMRKSNDKAAAADLHRMRLALLTAARRELAESVRFLKLPSHIDLGRSPSAP